MFKKITFLTILTTFLFTGCASVPIENQLATKRAKEFPAPSPGSAGLYIYRSSVLGTALKKDIWVNGRCIGETATKVFFYEEVPGDVQHTISTDI